MENFNFDDSHSVASSRRSGRSRSQARHSSGRSHHPRRAPSHYGDEESVYAPPTAIPRRHTQPDIGARDPPPQRPTVNRSMTDAEIDMDLAYGDYNPEVMVPRASGPPAPAPGANNMQLQKIEDPELNNLVNRAQMLLEEAECLHHSATTAMAQLQQHPDAMAAVALTLAEISNLISKMAPAALSMLKTAAPTIWALLASPQFLIAAGVGVGATIVMFGGYKIIKQIQGGDNNKPRAIEEPERPEALMEINTECLSHVEMWRRGVADAEANSSGTKVDGEFITPTAATMSGIDVNNARMSRDPRFKFDDKASMASSRYSRRSRSVHTPRRESKSKDSKEPKASSSIFSRVRSQSKPPSKAPSKAPSKVPPSKAPTPSKSLSKAPSKSPASKTYSESTPKDKEKDKPRRSSKLKLMFTT